MTILYITLQKLVMYGFNKITINEAKTFMLRASWLMLEINELKVEVEESEKASSRQESNPIPPVQYI